MAINKAKPKKCAQCGKALPKHPWSNIDTAKYGDDAERWFCSVKCVAASYE